MSKRKAASKFKKPPVKKEAPNKKKEEPLKEKVNDKIPVKAEKTKLSDNTTYLIVMAIIGLIAAVGGYPGVKQIWSNWSDKAEFRFKPATIALTPNNVGDSLFKTLILFSGILFNGGDKDLLPDNNGFELKIKFQDNSKIDGFSGALPKDLKLKYDETTVNYTNINDLQNTTKLQPGEPINGNFAFGLKEDSAIMSKIVHGNPLFVIKCTDILGKSYTDSFHFNFIKISFDYSNDKIGVDVKIKKPSPIPYSSGK